MSVNKLFENYVDDNSAEAESNLLKNIITYHESGGNLEENGSNGQRLIDVAVGDGLLTIIKWLNNNGVDLNTPDDQGWYPILTAVDSDIDGAIQNDQELTFNTVKLLVGLGVDTNVKTPENKGMRDISEDYGMKVLKVYDAEVAPVVGQE